MVGHVLGHAVHLVILVWQVVGCWLVGLVKLVIKHVQNLVILLWLRCVILIGVYVGLVFCLVYVLCM